MKLICKFLFDWSWNKIYSYRILQQILDYLKKKWNLTKCDIMKISNKMCRRRGKKKEHVNYNRQIDKQVWYIIYHIQIEPKGFAHLINCLLAYLTYPAANFNCSLMRHMVSKSTQPKWLLSWRAPYRSHWHKFPHLTYHGLFVSIWSRSWGSQWYW